MSATVYILLFRGVGGATQLPPKPLREALTEAGFENAGTYINSGNAYLKTDMPRAEMLETVAEICRKQFSFSKDIYARALAEWRKLIRQNPFEGKFSEGRFLHAAVLDELPSKQAIDVLQSMAVEGEGVELIDKVAYLHTPGGLSRSKLGTRFDKGLGVPNTARNWNTVLKLLDLAEQAAK